MKAMVLCGICGGLMGYVLAVNNIHTDSLTFWAVMIPWATVTTFLAFS